jgi:hypothetical protein
VEEELVVETASFFEFGCAVAFGAESSENAIGTTAVDDWIRVAGGFLSGHGVREGYKTISFGAASLAIGNDDSLENFAKFAKMLTKFF